MYLCGANLHHESSTNMCRQQQHKEIGSLFDCEPKRVTENRIKKHLVDDKLGGDGSSGQYQEPHNLNKGQGSLNLSILLVIIILIS